MPSINKEKGKKRERRKCQVEKTKNTPEYEHEQFTEPDNWGYSTPCRVGRMFDAFRLANSCHKGPETTC